MAPSLVEHLEDLLDGLKTGDYFFKGNEIIFPGCWCDRVKLRSKKAMMDEYGRVHDVPKK